MRRPRTNDKRLIWESLMQKTTDKPLTRRTMLGAGAAIIATPALAENCHIGPPEHEKGPLVWMNMDQIEIDAAYDQDFYAPAAANIRARYNTNSDAVRSRVGEPKREAYGASEIEKLDIYRAKKANAPTFVFIHGGAWLGGTSRGVGYPAEMFHNAGANYVALDFVQIKDAGGDLNMMADQVKRGIAWVYKNAKSFNADPAQIYIGGFSSGGHLCGVSLVTDWQKDFGIPNDFLKGALCMSGMYDMKPVRLSKRSSYIKFTDAMEDAMSTQRHLDRLHTSVVVSHGTAETPEFQRQNREFVAAVKAAGKPAELVVAPHYNHFEMGESLGNPYGPNGRAALAMMKLPILAS
jgi:arylformamidase